MDRSKHSYQTSYRVIDLSLLGLVCWSLPALLPEVGRLPDFELRDQFGVSRRAAELRGRFVAVIGSDRAGRDQSHSWSEVLQIGFPEAATAPRLEIVRVADLRGMPRLLEGIVAGRLRRQERGSVLLDWEGKLAEALGFEPGRANVVLFGPGGEVLFEARGEVPEGEGAARVQQRVRELLEQDAGAAELPGTESLLGRNGRDAATR